jgi:hypothetical protein
MRWIMADTHKHTHTRISSGSARNKLQTAYQVLVTYITEPGTPGEKEDQFVYLRDAQLHKDLLFECKVIVTC